MRLENSPPSAVFITCIGRKSGDDRGAPMAATRTCVCGAPGLSTISNARLRRRRTRPAPAHAGVPRCHAPNAFSASGRSSAIVMSPATTSAALFGHEVLLPERHHVVARHRLAPTPRSRARCSRTDAARRRAPRFDDPDASTLAFSRCCTSCARRLARCRSISSAGNDGCSATSASEFERRREILLQRPRGDRRRVHRAVRVQRSAELRDLVGNLQRVARRRALVEHRRR